MSDNSISADRCSLFAVASKGLTEDLARGACANFSGRKTTVSHPTAQLRQHPYAFACIQDGCDIFFHKFHKFKRHMKKQHDDFDKISKQVKTEEDMKNLSLQKAELLLATPEGEKQYQKTLMRNKLQSDHLPTEQELLIFITETYAILTTNNSEEVNNNQNNSEFKNQLTSKIIKNIKKQYGEFDFKCFGYGSFKDFTKNHGY